MANAYDGNGDYSNYTEDENEYGKQQKLGGPHNGDNSHGEPHQHGAGANMSPAESSYLNDKANEYIRDCLNEKTRMFRKFPISEKLLDSEIEKVQSTGRLPSREQKYADIYREKPLRVSQKVLVPIREHPKFNFVGKLLGPKGNSLRRLQEETMCKMTVLGRNSMRDRVKEEELRNSKDPKYSHLNSDLHVEISTVAPPAEAYARVAYAMAELRKYLIPDSNDVIRQEQLRELMDSTHISEEQKSSSFNKKVAPYQTPGNVGILTSAGASGVGVSGALVPGACSNPLGSQAKSTTPFKVAGQIAAGSSIPPAYNKNNIAPKQKVMSILEKARSAMEETYGRGYDDSQPYEHLQAPHSYDTYATYPVHAQQQPPSAHNPHGQQAPGIGISTMNAARAQYETVEYETSDYNRRDYYQNTTVTATASSYGTGIQPPNNGGINPNQSQNRSHVNSSLYLATKSGGTAAYQTMPQKSSNGAQETTTSCHSHNGPSLHTMTIPTQQQNNPPSLTQTQHISTSSSTTKNINQNDSIPLNTAPVATTLFHSQHYLNNSNKSLLTCQTLTTPSSITTTTQPCTSSSTDQQILHLLLRLLQLYMLANYHFCQYTSFELNKSPQRQQQQPYPPFITVKFTTSTNLHPSTTYSLTNNNNISALCTTKCCNYFKQFSIYIEIKNNKNDSTVRHKSSEI